MLAFIYLLMIVHAGCQWYKNIGNAIHFQHTMCWFLFTLVPYFMYNIHMMH